MDHAAVEDAAPKRSREHWILLAASAVAPLGLLAMRAFLKPAANGHGTHEQLGLPPCQMMERLGIPCPGCGVTTAVTHAARGELWRSFVTQPFGCALAVAAMLALPLALSAHFAGRDLYTTLGRFNRRPVWLGLIAFVFAAWIYKLVITLAS